jgi:predicted  nucleic acid-binding Zn-ribbon protein
MTPEQVKENLLKLHECAEGFTLEFSGRKNRRVNGQYDPADVKIIINNRNFEEGEAGDNLLFYTAMHELAHHIQHTEHHQHGSRCHTKLFYSILDGLADKAEKAGLYRYDADPEIKKLTDEAAMISAQIAALQRKLGGVLNKLHGACLRKGVRYEDVVKRKVRLSARTERKLQKIAALRLPDGVGFEQQEVIAGAKNDESRQAMLQAVEEGKSVAQVKQAGSGTKKEPDELGALVREKDRINATIVSLTRRLAAVVKRITLLEGGG